MSSMSGFQEEDLMRSLTITLFLALTTAPLAAEDDAAAQRASEVLLADDLNGDGKVAADEWSEENEKFLKIDKDADGFLTQAELTEFYANAATDEGEKAAGGDPKAPGGDPKAAGGDGGKRDRMKKLLEEKWKEVDKDGDGFLSAEEWTYGEESFAKADKDADGKVSREEMGGFLKEAMKTDTKLIAEMRLQAMDANKDGKVSQEEWKGPAEMFGKADKDADGFVTLEELVASMPNPKEKILGKLKEMDADGDGAISQEEWKGKPEMFGRLDKNGDGQITSDEMQGMGGGGGRRGPGK